MKMTLLDVNVVDVECTCWPRGEEPEGFLSEIIEIGLSLYNVQTGEVTCEGSIHILPSQVEISPFCTELTGITFDDLEYAETLQEALPALTANLLADQRVFASYGDFDRLQFERECEEKGIVYPFGRRHLNVKTLLAMKMGWSKELGMAEAMHKLGIEQLGRHHSAADDSFNIARLLKFALGRW